ncbi:HAD-IA family hydrolase [Lysobacter sp.]|uniref:HAD family hydrolase n=1 Tax=Lysobacter sp. TaxID=72226 RepID=UPI002D5AD759|nr:HAD-IA family hydrolase [Lysobacter sp.]HZX78728.1 HAD-IA family hydrolase [Lysobacter sp.]
MTDMRPAPRALLVDFDGVLRRWPENDWIIERAHGLPMGAIRAAAFEPALLARAITGAISDEAWRQEIVARLLMAHGSADVGAAVAEWSTPAGALDPRVHEILAQCRNGLRLVLVTNATTRLPQDMAQLGLDGFFHAIANSSAVGSAKPDAAMFEAALSMAGVAADEALYVDDSPRNVSVAQAMGLRSCVFRGHESLRAFLQSHGVWQTANAMARWDR